MVPMLAAGHVNGLGWDGGNARGRRATSWIAALLACALHVGIGSLIWRGMTPSPIPPAMPSDSESMFVELLAPPTPRAERSASPRGERAGRARAGFRGDARRRRCREHSPSAPSHRARSRCPRRRTLKKHADRRAASGSATSRPVRASRGASRLMRRPPARQRLRHAISVGSRRTRPRPANGARARTREARAQGAGRTHRAVARDGEGRASALPRCACVQGLLALPFLWLIRSRTAAASGDRRRRGRHV